MNPREQDIPETFLEKDEAFKGIKPAAQSADNDTDRIVENDEAAKKESADAYFEQHTKTAKEQ